MMLVFLDSLAEPIAQCYVECFDGASRVGTAHSSSFSGFVIKTNHNLSKKLKRLLYVLENYEYPIFFAVKILDI